MRGGARPAEGKGEGEGEGRGVPRRGSQPGD